MGGCWCWAEGRGALGSNYPCFQEPLPILRIFLHAALSLDISTPSLQQHPCRICCKRRVARNCRHYCALAACLLRVRVGPGRARPDRCWASGPFGWNLRSGGTVLGLPGRSVVRIQALRKPICANSPVCSRPESRSSAGKPVCTDCTPAGLLSG